ncbi:MAG TPA: hypothetical protein VIZ18_04845 [Ktedonobacteraceae bacterium]
MALVNKSSIRERAVRRIWKTPSSKWNWVFLAISVFTLGCVYLLYRNAIATQLYPGPYNPPFRQFGVVAFALVLVAAAYTLRRRFARSLPGKVQNWLWLHIWFGVISVAIACMHENFQTITHDVEWTKMRFTEYYFGTSALFALILLVVTGVVGRLLDMWQARVIAGEADTNGVGINRSVQDRMFELSLKVERLSAGKSEPFQQFCLEALAFQAELPPSLPVLHPGEIPDFELVYEALGERARLGLSLQRQQRARLIIRVWRYVHIPLACLAVLVISFHSLIELCKWVVLHY